MPPLDASELDIPMEFDALMTDERIKPVEVRPGIKFDMGGGKQAAHHGRLGRRHRHGREHRPGRGLRAHHAVLRARVVRPVHALPRGHRLAGARLQRLAEGEGRPGDVELFAIIAHGIAGNTICPLGDAAAWPMLGFLTKFRAEFEARIKPQDHWHPGGGQGRGGVSFALPGRRLDRRRGRLLDPGRDASSFFALFTITRKNPVAAVMSLVATFFGLAAMYAMLSAHFLAALQVLVYAGAIMVLFIFVVMVLNRDEVDAAVVPARCASLGVLAGVYLFVKFTDIVAGRASPRAARPRRPADFGTVGRGRRSAVHRLPVRLRGGLGAAAGRRRRRRGGRPLAPEGGRRGARRRLPQADPRAVQPRLPGRPDVARARRAPLDPPCRPLTI